MAAALLAAYGVLVLVNALVGQAQIGFSDVPDFIRGLGRVGISLVLAYSLVQLKTWAWWLSVLLVAMWLLFGGTALAIFVYMAIQPDLAPLSFPRVVWLAVPMLAAILLLLLTGSTRAAFRREV